MYKYTINVICITEYFFKITIINFLVLGYVQSEDGVIKDQPDSVIFFIKFVS